MLVCMATSSNPIMFFYKPTVSKYGFMHPQEHYIEMLTLQSMYTFTEYACVWEIIP